MVKRREMIKEGCSRLAIGRIRKFMPGSLFCVNLREVMMKVNENSLTMEVICHTLHRGLRSACRR